MIYNLKPYPAYKDSGVPWLGKIPEHWEVIRCGRLFREVVDTGHPDAELLSIDRFRGIIRQSETGRKERASEDRSSYKKVLPGELAYNLMNAFMGSIGFSTLEGIISPAYAVARPLRDIEPIYYHHLFRTQLFTTQFDRYSYGIMYERNRLYFERFKMIPTIIPSISEQAAIVHYINYIDRRIRRYIRAKQKLIKLLEEQKQAIIHQSVTRGLNPNVKLKPSGVEWLGDVPEHWEVLRSRYIFREVDERSVTGQEIHLSMSQKHGLIRSDQIETRRLVSESYIGAKICSCEDLVLNRLKAHLGVFALAPEKGLVSPDYTVLRSVSDIVPSYFEFVYRTPACRVELRQRAKGIVQGFWRLYTDDFYQIPVPVPPKHEQESIVTAVKERIKQIKEIVTQAEIEIALLREYRTRLIADVVTGKLDVREVAANLLDETNETEVLEEELYEDEVNTDEDLESESEEE